MALLHILAFLRSDIKLYSHLLFSSRHCYHWLTNDQFFRIKLYFTIVVLRTTLVPLHRGNLRDWGRSLQIVFVPLHTEWMWEIKAVADCSHWSFGKFYPCNSIRFLFRVHTAGGKPLTYLSKSHSSLIFASRDGNYPWDGIWEKWDTESRSSICVVSKACQSTLSL